jgi:hypothetical protein
MRAVAYEQAVSNESLPELRLANSWSTVDGGVDPLSAEPLNPRRNLARPRVQYVRIDAGLERILSEGEAQPEAEVRPSARGGDWRRMRGLPIVGLGIAGASPGTDPARAMLEMELRRGR